MSDTANATVPTVRKLERDTIITGEAIELEVTPASPALRAVASMFDAAFALLFTLVIAIIFNKIFGTVVSSNAGFTAIILIFLFTAQLAFPLTIEILTAGRSPGKLLVGTRVVRDDGGSIGPRHALVRCVTAVFELWMAFGAVAILVSIMNRRGKRLGDLLAGTYVIEVPESGQPVPLIMPPELAQWAEKLSIMPLEDGLEQGINQHLHQSRQLDPQLRHRRACELAASVERKISPPPPWGTHPERMLVAVMVTRRAREYEKLCASPPPIASASLPFGIGLTKGAS